MRHRRAFQIAVLAVLVGTTTASAEDLGKKWVGRRVVTKHGAVFYDAKRVVDDEKRTQNLIVSGRDRRLRRHYRVHGSSGGMLVLESENEEIVGAVPVSMVIPYEQAISYYTKEIQFNAASPTPYIDRATVWQLRHANDLAIADLNEALKRDPANENALNDRGVAWTELKEYDKALADFKQAIKVDPAIAVSYYNRGRVWYLKKDNDQALGDFNEAIRLDPQFALAFSNRGLAWIEKNEHEKALLDLEEAIRLDAKNPTAYVGRGRVAYAHGRLDEALSDFNTSIRLSAQDPYVQDPYVHTNCALIWLAKNDLDQAMKSFNRVLALDPGDSTTFNNRAGIWFLRHEYDRAIQDYNEALRLNPRSAWAFYGRGVTWQALKDYGKASADYERSIEADPLYVSGHIGRAWLLAACPDSRYRDGKKAVESALLVCDSSQWNNPESLRLLAASYAEENDFVAAVKWQEKVLKLPMESADRNQNYTLLDLFKAGKAFRFDTEPEKN